MSTSAISCKACHQVIASRHHSGQITVAAGIKVVMLPGGRNRLECRCGERRIVEVREKAA